ncbi:N-acetyltransferase [Candidatus Gottesmanbacteria bacterium]|nr:N-acetyltransferase [Candidatus Gottesmanbacteria bacterium]
MSGNSIIKNVELGEGSEINDFAKVVDCKIGDHTKIFSFTNLYGCSIGSNTMVGAFVEIQTGVKIGSYCRIQSHAFICSMVTIEDQVFVGHGVVFINDNKPNALEAINKTWKCLPVLIKKGASIGSNTTILGGVTIGEGAMIGAGAVVTKDVAAHSVVVGIPAKPLKNSGHEN